VRIREGLGKAPDCHRTMWPGTDSRFLTGEDKVIDPSVRDEFRQQIDRSGVERSAIARRFERENLDVAQLSGEMFHTVFGNLNGVYTWECDRVPSEDKIREGLCLRVIHDCRQFRKHDRCTELTAWHGGWTCEGIGIFSADIWSTSWSKRTRHLGRACVKVRTPTNSGSRTWNGMAC
jgi:hypothetical protein